MKIALITYNFNNYDIQRSPINLDSFIQYNYISKSSSNPIYDTYYVRYHPFEFVDSDMVILMDSSIQIKDSLNQLVNEFLQSNMIIGVLHSRFVTDEDKLMYWKFQRNAISNTEVKNVYNFISSLNQSRNYGSIR